MPKSRSPSRRLATSRFDANEAALPLFLFVVTRVTARVSKVSEWMSMSCRHSTRRGCDRTGGVGNTSAFRRVRGFPLGEAIGVRGQEVGPPDRVFGTQVDQPEIVVDGRHDAASVRRVIDVAGEAFRGGDGGVWKAQRVQIAHHDQIRQASDLQGGARRDRLWPSSARWRLALFATRASRSRHRRKRPTPGDVWIDPQEAHIRGQGEPHRRARVRQKHAANIV